MKNICNCGAQKDNRSIQCRTCHDQHEIHEKQCTHCRIIKPISAFRLRTRKVPRPRSHCKECETNQQKIKQRYINLTPEEIEQKRIKKREYNAKNREIISIKSRESILRKKYREEYDHVMAQYSSINSCQICGETNPSGRYKALMIDHDHVTGKYRGILCHNCNFGLGHFRDNTEFMYKAINYIQTYLTHSLPKPD